MTDAWLRVVLKQAPHRCLQTFVGRGADIYYFLNIDAQDQQDERVPLRVLTGEMIQRGVADAQDYRPAIS